MYFCRPEQVADRTAIHEVNAGAFPTTAEARLVDALNAADSGLANEYGVDEEFMVFALRPGTLPPPGSVVRYAPEFAQL